MRRFALLALLFVCLAGPAGSAWGAGAHPIGYLGCSNTRDAVMGYGMTAGKALLWPAYNTNGGRVDLWAQPDSAFWLAFDQQVAQNGQPLLVWVQLCENLIRQQDSFTEVRQLLTNLKQHAPHGGAVISAINIYNPLAGLCSFMGPTGKGETDTTQWRNNAVSLGLAKGGPDLGALTRTTTLTDGCHPNVAGEQLLGNQLHAFFDRLAPP